MKKIFIAFVLSTMLFTNTSFSVEKSEIRGGTGGTQITKYARGLPEDFEERKRRNRQLIDSLIKKRNDLLDGKEAVVRIYDNWEEDRTEYKERYVQLHCT